MLLSQIVQALAGSQASKLILKQQSLLVLCSKQFLSCRNCQRVRLLSSFSNSNCVYTASFSKNGMKSRKLSSNIKDTVSPQQTIGGRVRGTLQYFGWLLSRSSILQERARQIYACCTDEVDHIEFFKVFNMPDTFQSWFLVVHLHIWMCYARLNLFGDDGKIANQKMVEFMWEDIRERIKEIGIEDTKARKESFKELSQQFYGLTIAYNKALMSDNEKELADALFKTFFPEKTENNRRKLETLVHYVDIQLEMLDKLTKEEFLGASKIKWIPLADCTSNINKQNS